MIRIKLLCDYLKKMAIKSVNSYSIISTIFLIFAPLIIPVSETMEKALTNLFIFMAVFFAGFYVWIDVKEQISEKGKLKIDTCNFIFDDISWDGAIPYFPINCSLNLTLTNVGYEKLSLRTIDSYKHDDYDISWKVVNFVYYSGNTQSPLSLPIDIPKRDHKVISLHWEIMIGEHPPDSNKLAEIIRDLNSLELDIECKYKDMDGNKHKEKITAKESFQKIKDSFLAHWSTIREYDLVQRARS